MEFLLTLLAAIVSGLLGWLLWWLMQLARHATRDSDLAGLARTLKIFGQLLLAVYCLPVVVFVGFRGLGPALNHPYEVFLAVSLAALWLVGTALGLILVSLQLAKVESGRSLRSDPYVIAVLASAVLYLAVSAVLLTTTTLVGAVLVAFSVERFLRSRREERQGQLLWTLTLAAEAGRPLAPEIRESALEHRGVSQMQWRHASELLESGYSLAATLDAVPGLVPGWVRLMIRVGEEAGNLPATLREATLLFTRQARQHSSLEQAAAATRGAFLAVGVMGASMITTSLSIHIAPKFKKIWDGFDTPLPDITQALLQWYDAAVVYPLPLALLAGGAIYLTIVLLAAADSSRVIEYRLWGYLKPRVATSIVLRCLALVIRSGRSLGGTLGTLADTFPCRPLRPRLGHVAEEVTRGGNVWTALSRQKLLRAEEAELLFAADRAGNLPWTMQELAEGLDRRQRYRALAVREFVQPALVVLVGLLVLFIDAAFFLPIVELMEQLS